jgi:polyphosphate kinase 2
MATRKTDERQDGGRPSHSLSKNEYRKTLRHLQVELVKLQYHLIKSSEKILIILEGLDAAGKDGTIKRIIQHLSPRETRVVALGKPSDRENSAWYFQRYVSYLPAAQELVLFNRSWYNRAGVEKVMGFCTAAEHEEFMSSVMDFENMLIRSGVKFFKYYLDISKAEQKQRLKDRADDPLKQWKMGTIDSQAIKYWNAYSAARDEMLARTHGAMTPWTLVHADDKRQARINIIRDILARMDYARKSKTLTGPDRKIVFPYNAESPQAAHLAR